MRSLLSKVKNVAQLSNSLRSLVTRSGMANTFDPLRLPTSVARCKRCKGQLRILEVKNLTSTETSTLMIACDSCEVATIAPPIVAEYLQELKWSQAIK